MIQESPNLEGFMFIVAQIRTGTSRSMYYSIKSYTLEPVTTYAPLPIRLLIALAMHGA